MAANLACIDGLSLEHTVRRKKHIATIVPKFGLRISPKNVPTWQLTKYVIFQWNLTVFLLLNGPKMGPRSKGCFGPKCCNIFSTYGMYRLYSYSSFNCMYCFPYMLMAGPTVCRALL